MKTFTQICKERTSKPEHKAMIKAVRSEMKRLKASGASFDHLATCQYTYQVYLKVKYA